MKDFPSHKADCKWVGHFHDIMPKIEKNYREWKECGTAVNLFKTQIGEFCELNNRMLWDPPKTKQLKDIWPRDYMRMRCRMAEGMWEIARKHESYEATEDVLKEALATLRLDFSDRYAVKEFAVWMFLYLGNEYSQPRANRCSKNYILVVVVVYQFGKFLLFKAIFD